jgi:hypothetical protein
LHQLLSIRKWDASDAINLSLSAPQDAEEVVDEALVNHPLLPELLMDVSLAKDGYTLPSSEAADGDLSRLLGALQEASVVASSVPVAGALEEFRLTDEGRKMVKAGVSLTNATRILVPRAVPFHEMAPFELLCSLEMNGWEFRIVSSKRRKREAKPRLTHWARTRFGGPCRRGQNSSK